MTKPLVIYHANCADGFGAAWCFWNKFGTEVDFHPGFFTDPAPDVTDRDVYLVDFSYRHDVVKKMLDECKTLTMLDHHISAIKDLDDLKNHKRMFWHCDVNHSGAMLAWKFLNPESEFAPAGIEYIEDRDLWRFKYPNTKYYQAAVFSYPYDFKVWDDLILNKAPGDLIKEGEVILRKQEKDIAELLPLVTRREIFAGYDVPIANVPYFWCSEVGEILSKDEPFAVTYYDAKDGRKYSLRSHKDNPNAVDVSKIAFAFGGGGHKGAAGFTDSSVDYDTNLPSKL